MARYILVPKIRAKPSAKNKGRSSFAPSPVVSAGVSAVLMELTFRAESVRRRPKGAHHHRWGELLVLRGWRLPDARRRWDRQDGPARLADRPGLRPRRDG